MTTLTRKELFELTLTIGTLMLYVALTHGIQLPIISNYRWAIAIVGVLGIAMCATSAMIPSEPSSRWIKLSALLGVASLGLIIYGLIVGTANAFMALTVMIIVQWIVATLRHVFQG